MPRHTGGIGFPPGHDVGQYAKQEQDDRHMICDGYEHCPARGDQRCLWVLRTRFSSRRTRCCATQSSSACKSFAAVSGRLSWLESGAAVRRSGSRSRRSSSTTASSATTFRSEPHRTRGSTSRAARFACTPSITVRLCWSIPVYDEVLIETWSHSMPLYSRI